LIDEKRLLERIKAEDEAAFKEFFNVHNEAVFRLCFRILRDFQEAEDITQDVFFKAYLTMNKFRGESKVSTWLYRIAVNLSLNKQRRKKFKHILSLDFFSEKGDPQDRDPGKGPMERLTEAEEKLLVDKAVDSLPKNQRMAVILNHYEELSYHEISEILGLSISSVRSLLYRAKQRLQKKLASSFKNI
jgi:RNA polymerase sigma-70 factor (ECF subfamily)